MAIMEYLEETRPERKLMPDGAVPRAKVRQIANIIATVNHRRRSGSHDRSYVSVPQACAALL